MTTTISPTTKLKAVNICLSAMGEPVINSLDDAAIDAQMASDIVDETSESVQTIGWYWNTETHTLAPDVTGQIILPDNTIRVDPLDIRLGNIVQRGLKLFNTDTSTFIFTNPIKLRFSVLLEFDDLPLTAKQFIAIRSARICQQRMLGSDTLYKFDSADENRAWAVLMQEEAETMNANVLRDNWSAASILNRAYFARGAY
ncbi:hypothetical protein [Bradyrhizobium sp. SZCCHNRI2049]|uniref:hypothetical protein n=1 Tax=Bradyrhizobium sp. SZCCHNRI2049 TaxID=3057287 RepID=UPI00291689D0|nr:hypothetical protein [Bradyrhizobium sp. SZCCHNRI2049]